MAAATLAAPGAEYGPCEVPCFHLDCEATVRMAASICRYCEQPIGYDRRFYNDYSDRLVHASCLEEHLSFRKV